MTRRIQHIKPKTSTFKVGRASIPILNQDATPRKKGRAGQNQRYAVLARDLYTCQACGYISTDNEADHTIPLEMGGQDHPSNMATLCKVCHAKKTALEAGLRAHKEGQATTLYPEWIKPTLEPCHLIFGPPGSGKSTHVKANAKPNDLIIDLDEIMADLSGLPIYHAGEDYFKPAIRARNYLISKLSTLPQVAWIIITATNPDAIQWWQSKQPTAQTTILKTPLEECIRRINLDDRRPQQVKERSCEAAMAWWANHS